jgi:hypothetical protein
MDLQYHRKISHLWSPFFPCDNLLLQFNLVGMHQFQLHVDLWDQTDSYKFRCYHHNKGPKNTSNVKFASHVREEIRLRTNKEFEVKWNLVMQEKFKQHNWGQCNPTPMNAPPQFSRFESIQLANFGTLGTNLEPSAMGRFPGKPRTQWKKVSFPHAIHPQQCIHVCYFTLVLILAWSWIVWWVQGGRNAQTKFCQKQHYEHKENMEIT